MITKRKAKFGYVAYEKNILYRCSGCGMRIRSKVYRSKTKSLIAKNLARSVCRRVRNKNNFFCQNCWHRYYNISLLT